MTTNPERVRLKVGGKRGENIKKKMGVKEIGTSEKYKCGMEREENKRRVRG